MTGPEQGDPVPEKHDGQNGSNTYLDRQNCVPGDVKIAQLLLGTEENIDRLRTLEAWRLVYHHRRQEIEEIQLAFACGVDLAKSPHGVRWAH